MMVNRIDRKVRESKSVYDVERILSKLEMCRKKRENHRQMFVEYHDRNIDANHQHFIQEIQTLIRRCEDKIKSIEDLKKRTTTALSKTNQEESEDDEEGEKEERKEGMEEKTGSRKSKLKGDQKRPQPNDEPGISQRNIEERNMYQVQEKLKEVLLTKNTDKNSALVKHEELSQELKIISKEFFPDSQGLRDVLDRVKDPAENLFASWAVPENQPYVLACCLLSGFIDLDGIDEDNYESLKKQSETFFCSLSNKRSKANQWYLNVCVNKVNGRISDGIHNADVIFYLHSSLVATSVDDRLCDVFLLKPYALRDVYRRTIFFSMLRIAHRFATKDTEYHKQCKERRGDDVILSGRVLEYQVQVKEMSEAVLMRVTRDIMIRNIFILCLTMIKLCNGSGRRYVMQDDNIYENMISFCMSVENGEKIIPQWKIDGSDSKENLIDLEFMSRITASVGATLRMSEKGTTAIKDDIKPWVAMEKSIFALFKSLFVRLVYPLLSLFTDYGHYDQLQFRGHIKKVGKVVFKDVFQASVALPSSKGIESMLHENNAGINITTLSGEIKLPRGVDDLANIFKKISGITEEEYESGKLDGAAIAMRLMFGF